MTKVVTKAVKKAGKAIVKAEKAVVKAVQGRTSKDSSPAPARLVVSEFTPLDDRLIIQIDEAPETTAGGIIIPGVASERPSSGVVLAAGPGRRNKKGVLRPLDVVVGDKVLFPQFAGQKIEIGSHEFLILREDELFAITTA